MAGRARKIENGMLAEPIASQFASKCMETGFTQQEVLNCMVRIFNLYGPNLFDLLRVEKHLEIRPEQPTVTNEYLEEEIKKVTEEAAVELETGISAIENTTEKKKSYSSRPRRNQTKKAKQINWSKVKPFGIPVLVK